VLLLLDHVNSPEISRFLTNSLCEFKRIEKNSCEFEIFFDLREISYHKNCSNDENISKKAIANFPEFVRIPLNSLEFACV
jgi:hypothetical protein